MSDSTLSFSEDCDLNKDMTDAGPTSTLFCICCLQSEIAYVNLRTCSHGDFLKNFVMPELKLEEQVICCQCHNMLKRIKLFKLQVEESFKLLSDSVGNISKSSQQSSNLQKHQTFTIDIPSTWKKRKLQTKPKGNSQTKRKKNNTNNNLITEEKPKTNNTEKLQTMPEHANIVVENSFISNIDKKTKNIEDALKIININQNSGCIDLLASSLKTISYSLLSNIYNTNVDIGNEIGRNPIDIIFSNNTPTNNATSISSENYKINNTKENNNTNLELENQIGRHPTNGLLSIKTPTTTIATSDSRQNITENNKITIADRLKTENSDVIENVANEELDPLEKDESMNGDQNNMQTEKTFMNRPSIDSKIRQVTLTREKLTEERSKIASSPTFFRLPHRCETCLVGFQFRENLHDHVSRKHTEDKIRNPEKCDICLQFIDTCNYEKHLFWHLTRYECIACSQQFASFDKAAQHYRKHHRSAKLRPLIKCPKCPYKTQRCKGPRQGNRNKLNLISDRTSSEKHAAD